MSPPFTSTHSSPRMVGTMPAWHVASTQDCTEGHGAYLVISQRQLDLAQGLGLPSHCKCLVPGDGMDGGLARWMNEWRKAHQH